MRALDYLSQNNGEVTKKYYANLSVTGIEGQIAVALFRAQKRSSRAKDYRSGKYRRAAYDVKSWSMGEVCRLLLAHGAELGITFGWKQDTAVVFGEQPSWVLYVDLPKEWQVSFHSPDRMTGPDYAGEWCGEHLSAERICRLCDRVMGNVLATA